jgi:hypothetical protein
MVFSSWPCEFTGETHPARRRCQAGLRQAVAGCPCYLDGAPNVAA